MAKKKGFEYDLQKYFSNLAKDDEKRKKKKKKVVRRKKAPKVKKAYKNKKIKYKNSVAFDLLFSLHDTICGNRDKYGLKKKKARTLVKDIYRKLVK